MSDYQDEHQMRLKKLEELKKAGSCFSAFAPHSFNLIVDTDIKSFGATADKLQ